jgi:hypothetical protein
METTKQKTTWQLMAFVGIALTAMVAWYGWLGWDQTLDQHPDSSTSGPYEPWQVTGLVVTLLVPIAWAATRRYSPAAVAGTTIGLTAAAFYDWSDDESGLFIVGVGMIMIGAVVLTTVTTAVVSALANRAGEAR